MSKESKKKKKQKIKGSKKKIMRSSPSSYGSPEPDFKEHAPIPISDDDFAMLMNVFAVGDPNEKSLKERITQNVLDSIMKKVKKRIMKEGRMSRKLLRSYIRSYTRRMINIHLEEYHSMSTTAGILSAEPIKQLETAPLKTFKGCVCMDSSLVIPTPDGDKRVSDLKVGDRIYGPRGKHLYITAGGYSEDQPEYEDKDSDTDVNCCDEDAE